MELSLLGIGQPLHDLHRQIGQVIGVSDLNRIRVVVLREIPLPKHDELAQIAQEHGLITNRTTGMTFGHAILLKDRTYDLETVVHELVHVLQYERLAGSMNSWRRTFPKSFTRRTIRTGRWNETLLKLPDESVEPPVEAVRRMQAAA